MPAPVCTSQDNYQGSSSGTTVYQCGITSGNLLWIAIRYLDKVTVSAVPTDTSGVGNTYTCSALVDTPVPSDPTKVASLNICYSIAAGTVTTPVTVNANCINTDGCHIEAGQFTGLASSPEATATGTGGTGVTPISATLTTTHSGDVIISAIGAAFFGSGDTYPSSPVQSLAMRGSQDQGYAGYISAGAPGSYTSTYNYTYTDTTHAVIALAFAPSSTRITDTQMPDGGNGVAYFAHIHGIGGTAAFTCSITVGALPTGLSLSGTGNCDITGTPSVVATTTFTAHIDDGAGHTASQSLSIKTGTTLNIPGIRSTNFFSPLGGNHSTTVTGAQCSDVNAIFSDGQEVFDFNGWLGGVNNTNEFWTGSLGDTFARLASQPITGTKNTPDTVLVSSPTTTSGTDTISYGIYFSGAHVSQTAGILNISGAQSVIDPGVFATDQGDSTTLSAAFTSVVPNTLACAYSFAANNGLLNMTNVTINSPFTLEGSFFRAQGAIGVGCYLIPSPTTVTAQITWTGTGSFGTNITTKSIGILGFRPGIAGGVSCAVQFAGLGEKYRRVTW